MRIRSAGPARPWHAAIVVLAFWIAPGTTMARGQEPTIASSEEIEPRVIGRRGTTTIGFAGFMDRFFSPEDVLPGHYLVQVDGARFLMRRVAVRAGVAGTGTFGGAEDEGTAGAGAPSLHGMGGVLFYFTPQSILSAYAGADYWLQLTRRADRDAGVLLGVAGLHGALSSRASAFVEAGLGAGLTRGGDGERLTRITGRIGIRIRL